MSNKFCLICCCLLISNGIINDTNIDVCLSNDYNREYILPENALSFNSLNSISNKHVNQWRNNGYILIDNLIPNDLINQVIYDVSELYKNTSEYRTDFGSHGKSEFPSKIESINELTLHPRILKAVSQLLGTDDILLTQGNVWGKKGILQKQNKPRENHDQRMHMDFPNHFWVHPTKWDSPDAVEMIIYLSDSDISGGNTAVVPRINNTDELYKWPYKNMPGFGKLQWINDRKLAESFIQQNDQNMYLFRQKLYKREKFVSFKPGTVLFYRFDLWHRGTQMKKDQIRYVENIVYKKRSANYINYWNRGFTSFMYKESQYLERLIAKLNVLQRNVVGFPKPGDIYWNEYTINAVKERYQCFGIDMTPYINALKKT